MSSSRLPPGWKSCCCPTTGRSSPSPAVPKIAAAAAWTRPLLTVLTSHPPPPQMPAAVRLVRFRFALFGKQGVCPSAGLDFGVASWFDRLRCLHKQRTRFYKLREIRFGGLFGAVASQLGWLKVESMTWALESLRYLCLRVPDDKYR